MKRILEIGRRARIRRPVIYKTVTKASVILVLSLLWDRFVNRSGGLIGLNRPFAVLGLVCIGLAWFSYLALDGMKIHYLNEGMGSKKKKKHRTKDIADFVDEKVISFDELEREEQIVCNLLSNLLAGLIFVLLSLVI